MTTKNAAWTPLPPREWNRDKARHLASRLGFSLHPIILDDFEQRGPQGVVEHYLLQPKTMPPFDSLASMRNAIGSMASMAPDKRRAERKELQKQGRESFADYAIAWYRFANRPENSPQEKLCLFFQNVWVVSFQGVKSVPDLFDYQNRIRLNLASNYPELCRQLTLTNAMGRYLDLGKNKAGAPNENFARELFELFTLGEGNYSENDIKETARALTGYSFRPDGKIVFRPRAHDDGIKTVFGKKGRFKLEDIINLVFQQEAAATFLPQNFLHYYLSEQDIEPNQLKELGAIWKKSSYSLATLYRTIFASQLFYDKNVRSNLIKSPVHYYLGLHQDFELEVAPLARDCLRSSRLMGQAFFNPPNVKGWDGGRAWINSATIAARREVSFNLFRELNTDRLNADEINALKQDQTENPKVEYRISLDSFFKHQTESQTIAQYISDRLFANPRNELFENFAVQTLPSEKQVSETDKNLLLQTAINSPAYQLS